MQRSEQAVLVTARDNDSNRFTPAGKNSQCMTSIPHRPYMSTFHDNIIQLGPGPTSSSRMFSQRPFVGPKPAYTSLGHTDRGAGHRPTLQC